MSALSLIAAAKAPSGTDFLPASPDPKGIPGSAVLDTLANGVEGWALIAAVVGIVVGAIVWAFGHYSQNYQQAFNGRKGVLVSGLAALLIGAAPHLIHTLQVTGTGVQ
jgi:MFS family permease